MDEELTKLIDLIYSRFRDEFEKQIMQDEAEMIERFSARGRLRSGSCYSSIIDLHLDKIRKLYKRRLEIEKQLMLEKLLKQDFPPMQRQ
jgi:hypothetical protein